MAEIVFTVIVKFLSSYTVDYKNPSALKMKPAFCYYCWYICKRWYGITSQKPVIFVTSIITLLPLHLSSKSSVLQVFQTDFCMCFFILPCILKFVLISDCET